MKYEFDTRLHGETVTVHISTFQSYEDEAPYIDFEVLDKDGEQVELTDEEVDEFLIEIIEFMEEEAEMERAERKEQQGGW